MSLYRDFLGKLTRQFEAALVAIDAVHSLTLGSEFEIALCEILRRILPDRFGVCRGFAVSATGEVAGDDIIVFDRSNFPTIRMLGADNFARLEQVPIEAIYAYIEVKHTLELEGDGDSSIEHAVDQAAKVKKLVSTREQIPLNRIARGLDVDGVRIMSPLGYPNYLNPMYTGILSRRTRMSASSRETAESDAVDSFFEDQKRIPSVSSECAPDIVVIGPSHLILPVSISNDGKKVINSPFYIENASQFVVLRKDGQAFGIAMACFISALEYIRLGAMPWLKIIASSFGYSMR